MDEDNVEDVVCIEDDDSRQSTASIHSNSESVSTENRPLLLLFERLIANDTKTNTVLTNAQIMLILEKEFDMNIAPLHELQTEIYISTVKKFLKDWPRWDSFDRVITRMKNKSGASKMIKTLLEQQYTHLKKYLKEMIDLTTPAAEEAVAELQKIKDKSFKSTESETNNTVLEIYCTRRQLNKFIYNKPNPQENNSIFNLVKFEPYKLDRMVPHFTVSSLLHWYGVRLSIELKNFGYTRFTTHRLTHTLVNECNGPRDVRKTLNQGIHLKPIKNVQPEEFPIKEIHLVLDKVLEFYRKKIEFEMIQDIFNVIKNDLNIDSTTIEVPGMYKTYSSKYPYVRKLYADVEAESNHDFYIEETITPIQDWHVGKVHRIEGPILVPPLQTWLKFECEECKQKFNGAEFLTLLRDHFRVYHTEEPNWCCTNCNKEFEMAEITNLGWQHSC